MGDRLKTRLFLAMFEEKKWPQTGKKSPSVRVLYCNPSGVVELLGREPLMFARVAQNTGVGPCSTFKTFCFVLGVLKRGVLLLGGGGGYLPRYSATGVPSEYMVYATSI